LNILRRGRETVASASALVALAATSCAPQAKEPSSSAVPPAREGAALSISVAGPHLVDGAGRVVQLRGVSYSGAEYACGRSGEVFDGPADDSLADAIARWGANTVRVPINGQCWAAIPRYTDEIAKLVGLLHARGLYVILDLHWSAPPPMRADRLRPMPNAAKDPDTWRSISRRFADDAAVLFDAYNEPFPDRAGVEGNPWKCWRDGCVVKDEDGAYRAAGMAELVSAIRSTGAKQPILLAGLDYANDVRDFLAYRPPDRALALSVHVYSFNRCRDEACWGAEIAPSLKQVPVVATEIGEDDCAHGFIDRFMRWSDEHGVSYLGWSFNPWDGASPTACGAQKVALIADWSGEPTPYGRGLRDHLLARARR
jgi:hypothetical protein